MMDSHGAGLRNAPFKKSLFPVASIDVMEMFRKRWCEVRRRQLPFPHRRLELLLQVKVVNVRR